MPTEAQKRRFARLALDGCLACRKLGFEREAEMHHPFGRVGKNYDLVIPLCAWCHRGVSDISNPHQSYPPGFGPSLAHNKLAFHDRFGSPEEMLAEVTEQEGA